MPITRKDLFTTVHSSTIRFIKQLTQQEYDQLPSEDPGTIYIITEEPNPGPVLQCPYVMDSRNVPSLGIIAYSTFDYTDGVVTASSSDTTGANAYAAAVSDLDRIQAGVPSGESQFWSIAPNTGKIAFEGEAVTLPDGNYAISVDVVTGNFLDANYGQIVSGLDPNNLLTNTTGAGARLLANPGFVNYGRPPQNGDRFGIVVDTATGQVDMVNEVFHENYGGQALIDMSDGAGFLLFMGQASNVTVPGTVKGYTKAADMQLPYPAGTTDTCLTGGLRELVTYPLNANEAELQGLGIDERLSMSLAEQRGEFETNANTGSIYEAFAMPAGISTGTADPLDLTTGVVAFEFEYSLPAHVSGGAGSLAVLRNDFRLVDPAFSNWLELRFRLQDDGTYLRDIEVGGQSVPADAASASSKVGILIDNANGELRVWFDGVELGAPIPWISPPPAALLVAMNATQTINWDGTVGLVAQNRLITEPHFFTTPFPAGSRDINGNVFN